MTYVSEINGSGIQKSAKFKKLHKIESVKTPYF